MARSSLLKVIVVLAIALLLGFALFRGDEGEVAVTQNSPSQAEAPGRTPRSTQPRVAQAQSAPAPVPGSARSLVPRRPKREPTITEEACALIDAAAVQEMFGEPVAVTAKPIPRRHGIEIFSRCEIMRPEAGRPILVDVLRQTTQGAGPTLQEFWNTETGKEGAAVIRAFSGSAFWVPSRPPLDQILLVRGPDAVYQIASPGRLGEDDKARFEAVATILLRR